MLLIGSIMGTTAFLLEELEAFIEHHMIKPYLEAEYILVEGHTKSYIAFISLTSLFGFLAGILTVYFGPGAAGSGVAELTGYMNGINYPNFIGIKTLIAKIVGVALAINAKLCVGKEGPLSHIGANIGAMCLQIPGFEHLRNDEKKR